MKQITLCCLFLFNFFIGLSSLQAKHWSDNVPYLVYSSRYFGANAFPIPELMGGKLSSRWEIELRGEYHTMPGDQTKDVYARLYVPIAKGRAGITVCGVIREWYNTSPEVRDERKAVELTSPMPCNGDVILNFHYQVLNNEKWMDIILNANLKTASGGRLCDARYTDAASYWFDCNIGRTLWKDNNASFRVQGLVGFYCWMTNSITERQNDALCYGLGMQGTYRSFTLNCDYAGIRGYRYNGDKPMVIRTKLNYELKKNILSFGYKHGMKDHLYDTYSLAYIRCF